MKYSMTRPETTEMSVSLFARTLHPELFESCEQFEHIGKNYRATVQITSLGHQVEFQVGEDFVTEVLDCKHAMLPRIKRLCLFPVDTSRSLKYTLDSGQKINLCFDCEYLAPDVYRRMEEEYWKDAQSATLSQILPDSHTQTPGLNFIRVDPTDDAIGVHSYHLYPEEHAIVKTQSLFTA